MGRVSVNESRASAVAVAAPPLLTPPAPEVEERLKEMQAQLPDQARQALAAKLVRPKSFDAVSLKPLGASPPRPTRRAAVRALPDQDKIQRDQARAQAICAAFDRKVPSVPNACAAVPP